MFNLASPLWLFVDYTTTPYIGVTTRTTREPVKLMGAYGHLLDRETPPLDADTYKNLYWPYPVGHFDNPGN